MPEANRLLEHVRDYMKDKPEVFDLTSGYVYAGGNFLFRHDIGPRSNDFFLRMKEIDATVPARQAWLDETFGSGLFKVTPLDTGDLVIDVHLQKLEKLTVAQEARISAQTGVSHGIA